jgi:ParB family chromosome partitioning protein
MSKKKVLGRGLDAILSGSETEISPSDISGNYDLGVVAEVVIEQIEINPFQPRTEFDNLSLEELAESIKKQGVIQPITIRKTDNNMYQLISGERRLRASKLIGLKTIPAYIRLANDEQMLEMSLVENIQRENLNAIEIAISYQRLIDECNITQEELSNRISKSRSSIANYIRLLKLPVEVQLALKSNQISMGHARSLLPIDDKITQLKLLEKIIKQRLSVRDIELLVKKIINPLEHIQYHRKAEPTPAMKEYSGLISEALSKSINLKVGRGGKGKITIDFDSEEDLRNIMLIISSDAL